MLQALGVSWDSDGQLLSVPPALRAHSELARPPDAQRGLLVLEPLDGSPALAAGHSSSGPARPPSYGAYSFSPGFSPGWNSWDHGGPYADYSPGEAPAAAEAPCSGGAAQPIAEPPPERRSSGSPSSWAAAGDCADAAQPAHCDPREAASQQRGAQAGTEAGTGVGTEPWPRRRTPGAAGGSWPVVINLLGSSDSSPSQHSRGAAQPLPRPGEEPTPSPSPSPARAQLGQTSAHPAKIPLFLLSWQSSQRLKQCARLCTQMPLRQRLRMLGADCGGTDCAPQGPAPSDSRPAAAAAKKAGGKLSASGIGERSRDHNPEPARGVPLSSSPSSSLLQHVRRQQRPESGPEAASAPLPSLQAPGSSALGAVGSGGGARVGAGGGDFAARLAELSDSALRTILTRFGLKAGARAYMIEKVAQVNEMDTGEDLLLPFSPKPPKKRSRMGAAALRPPRPPQSRAPPKRVAGGAAGGVAEDGDAGECSGAEGGAAAGGRVLKRLRGTKEEVLDQLGDFIKVRCMAKGPPIDLGPAVWTLPLPAPAEPDGAVGGDAADAAGGPGRCDGRAGSRWHLCGTRHAVQARPPQASRGMCGEGMLKPYVAPSPHPVSAAAIW